MLHITGVLIDFLLQFISSKSKSQFGKKFHQFCSMWHGQHNWGICCLHCLSNFAPYPFTKLKMRWRHNLPTGQAILSIQWCGRVLRRTKQSCILPVTCHLDQNHENIDKINKIIFFVQPLYCKTSLLIHPMGCMCFLEKQAFKLLL